MKKFNVGIQLYGVRNAMAEDFEGTLRAIRDMGHEYVEFAGYYGKTSEEIKAILDELKRKYPRCEAQDASFREYGFGATLITVRG